MARPPRLPLFGPRRKPINAGTADVYPAAEGGPVSVARPGQAPRRLWPIFLAGLLLSAAVAGILISTGLLRDTGSRTATVEPLTIPSTTVEEGAEASERSRAAARLGFPTFATKNTTRIGGADPVENAAAAALAVYPSSGESTGPNAVTLVPEDSWPAAFAAAVLTAPPLSAPSLISGADGLAEPSEAALAALNPGGRGAANGTQVITVGAVPAPEGFETRAVEGATAAEIAANLATLRRQLTGEQPGAFLLISDSSPAFAMPAASWAARSGDPILITGTDVLPEPTETLLARNPGTPVYLLGPEDVISKRVERRLRRGGRSVTRIAGPDPVTNAIEFARFGDGSFGWNIIDPGHGLVVTADSQPLNAVAAAHMAAAGTWGPLLLTNDAEVVPGSLRGYLLDIKPGYTEDPTRALYNHVWIVGNPAEITVGQQATLDHLAELEKIETVVEQPANVAPSGDNQGPQAQKQEAKP